MEFLRSSLARYVAIATVASLLLIILLAPLASTMVEGWSRRDVELRARLVQHSVRAHLAGGQVVVPGFDPVGYFERLSEDERLTALGFCAADGALRHATRLMPREVGCGDLARGPGETFTTLTTGDRRIHVSVFPMAVGAAAGHLLVVHDLAFIEQRARSARFYTVLSLVGVAVGLGLLSTVTIVALMRAWTRSIRRAIAEARDQAGGPAKPRDDFPVGREMRALLDEIREDRNADDGFHVEWSPRTLHRLLADELPDTKVLVVSNREPYIHNRADAGGVALQVPASGLVAALEPVMRACGGTWIAHGSGTADRETVDAHDRLGVPPAAPAYTLRRVWLSDDEQDGYYYGAANEGLWPLCHIAFVRPVFRDEDWARYVAVNRRFADAVVEEAGCDDPVVLVQDYHFALLPRMIRERLPRATILTFWHIPWPNAETFSICPWREAIIDGLLGSTILGFHTQLHCNNFLEAVDRFMESRIDRERASVALGGGETTVRPYPISIEWPPAALASQASVNECRAAVRRRHGLDPEMRVAVGIERFDYTKGILDRIRAVDNLLTRQPEWRRKLTFIQVAAPTRGKLDAYSALHVEAERLAEEVNARHGDDGYKPILLIVRHHEPNEIFELFRAADMCVVSSLHDGMNLVAKEFVAARDDEHGVLILSTFAGAAQELSEALIVNPYDTQGMAKAFDAALRMTATEQRERMLMMRDLVRRRNVYRWAARMLLDAARLRRREHIRIEAAANAA
ncbi:MAG: trehalose-6-phosphate synthase [Rhodospirillales bacterium]|nr:MAG: trehalose-6-phosphate synthase [Rhodospirillales bacterium]